ncbi:MAG TPA: hypothetical protein VF644_21625 [Pyrinomonadaceae bacterium]|jgi:hypothetical protein
MKNNLSILRNTILCGAFLVTFGWVTSSFAQTQCPVDNRLVKMPASDDKYYLPENYIFKVKFDAPISTDTYKTGSIVQFSVVENVFGIKLPEYETEAELTAFRVKLNESVESFVKKTKAILTPYEEESDKINKSNTSDEVKTQQLEESNKTKDEDLKELYVAQAKEIKELFETERKKFEEKFETKYKEAVLKVEDKFKEDTADVKNKFQSDINAIPDTDPDKKDKVEKINDRRYEKLEKLEVDRAGKLEKLETGKAESLKKLKTMPEIVTVIPKDSKGFGKVERAKRQAPLFLNYKARISVVLDYVLLANGDCIPIQIRETPDNRLYDGEYTELGGVINCKSDGLEGKKCIKGRRPRYNFISPIISGLATVATVLLKDPTAQAIAGVTAAEQLTKGDLGNVINGADSTISDKLIYEVLTTESRIGTIKKEDKK